MKTYLVNRTNTIRFLALFLSFFLFFCASNKALGQFCPSPAPGEFEVQPRIWTSGGVSYVKVRLVFLVGGQIYDWGQVTRSGREVTINAQVSGPGPEGGGGAQVVQQVERTYTLGALPAGTYTFTFKSYGVTMKTQQFDPSTVIEQWATLNEANVVGSAAGTNGSFASVYARFAFPDTGFSVSDWGRVTRSGNQFSVDIKAERGPGVANSTSDAEERYDLGTLMPGNYSFVIRVYGRVMEERSFTMPDPPRPFWPVPPCPAGTPQPPSALSLLTAVTSTSAIAVESVTFARDPFPLTASHSASADGRTRVILFASGVELRPDEDSSVVTAQAEDSRQNVQPLAVEHVGKVPDQSWLTQIIVRLPEGSAGSEYLWVSIGLHGQVSNQALIRTKPVEGTLP